MSVALEIEPWPGKVFMYGSLLLYFREIGIWPQLCGEDVLHSVLRLAEVLDLDNMKHKIQYFGDHHARQDDFLPIDLIYEVREKYSKPSSGFSQDSHGRG